MRNRVTIVERTFKVNPKKRAVVCIIECKFNWPTEIDTAWGSDFYKYCRKVTGASTVGRSDYFTVVGVSKCHADDTFDEVLGKRIAESRAKKDAYDKAYKVWNMIYKHYIKMAKLASNMAVACFKAKNIEVEHIIRLKG